MSSFPPPPSVTDVSENTITLTWSNSSGSDALEIHARLAPGAWSSARVFHVPPNTRSFILTELEMQSPYEVRFEKIGADGKRVASASVCIDTAPAGCGKKSKKKSPGPSCKVA